MSLLRSSLIVSLLSLFGSIISFVNQIVIANFFGASLQLDAYLIASSLPTLISGTISAVMSYSMVPILITSRALGTSSRDFTSMLMFFFISLSLAITLVGYTIAPLLISFMGVSLPPTVHADAVFMARISWFTSGISVITGFLCVLHNARKSFRLPVFSSFPPYIGMLFFGILYGKAIGPVAIAWGMLIGTLVGGGVLLKGINVELHLSRTVFSCWSKAIHVFQCMPMVLMAMGIFTFYPTIDSFWAPRLGTGNLAYLGYCQRLLIALGALIISGPSVVLVPRLAEAHMENRHEDFLSDLAKAVRMVLVIAAPVAITVALLATPIIELLFQRGAFNAEATRGVSAILPIMMFGLVAMVCEVIIVRALYARGENLFAALLGLMNIIIYFSLSGFLGHLFGVKGIAFAYAISTWSNLLGAFYISWRGKFSSSSILHFKSFLFRMFFALSISGLATWGASIIFIVPLSVTGFLGLLARTSFSAIIGVGVFFLVARFYFRMEDIHVLIEGISGRIYPLKSCSKACD